jgi:nitrile hydratase subunit alpha
MNKRDAMLDLLRLARRVQMPVRALGRRLRHPRAALLDVPDRALLPADHAMAEPAQRAHALQAAILAREPDFRFYQSVFARSAVEEWNPRNGARVVARAWLDPGFRARLMRNGTAACAELGYSGPQGEYIVVLENTPAVHNVIVCTLCSCTAWPVLGLPPDWYKSFEYRSRVVRESRAVLHEMGFDPPIETQIRVWDTTAETRYLVLPMRPADTAGWTEHALAAIVTREAMIGVAPVTVTRPAAACDGGRSA